MTILNRVRSLVVVNSANNVLALSLDLQSKPKSAQRPFFGGSQKAGWFYLFSNDSTHPGKVLECVVSPLGDSISSCYMGHPVLGSPGELFRTREQLVDELAAKVGLSWDAVGVDDAARGRTLGLNELSTGQLIDMLQERRDGRVIGVTDSHGIDPKAPSNYIGEKQVGRAKFEDGYVLKQQVDGTIVPVPILD